MDDNVKGGRGIAFLALFISIIALVIAIMAYQRTGAGIESLEQALQGARDETANALDQLEGLIRGSQPQRR